ncbi:MAG: glycosyltransferase [Anaerolineae bacterium]
MGLSERTAVSAPWPEVSVIVPTYNRPQALRECLEALAAQTYPKQRLQVVVVDDGSPQAPTGAVAAVQARLEVTLLCQDRKGPAEARNRGAEVAKGEYIAFTDDDCRPAPGWLQRLVEHLRMWAGCVVGGHTVNALTSNPYATASQMLIDYLYEYYNGNPGRARFLTSNNLAMPAATFRALGGFSRAYVRAAAEDRDFCDHCLHAGIRMVYVPEAVVYHAHRMGLRDFWRQHFHYGRGAAIYRQTHARRWLTAVRVEPSSFYLRLFSYPFRRADRTAPRCQALLLGLAQVANAAGFVWQACIGQRHAGN